jgi:predicted enzyme related to lactoylglutathione lyase
MMKHNVVGWFEIYVEDMERAKEFYAHVFQYGEYMDLSDSNMQMFAFPWVMNGEFASGALVKADGIEPGKGGTLVYFNCEDCAVELARIPEYGGRIIKPKFAIGEYGFIGLAMDTEGNLIGLHSKK